MVDPLIVFTGRSLSAAMVVGALFISTWYSSEPILTVPEGVIRVWAFTALTMSVGDSPCACKSRYIEIDLDLPYLAAVWIRRRGAQPQLPVACE